MSDRNTETYLADGEVLRRILDLFDRADPASREKILHTLHTFFLFDAPRRPLQSPISLGASYESNDDISVSSKVSSFSEDRTASAKDFIMEKRPQTDVEKVACLAYFLSHYRGTENFKTLDISKLNTEAAQIKLSNAAQAVENAAKAGFVISSSKGHKKISALGEIYVQALPDRVAARAAIAHAKPKRRRQREK
jgi:hypothetical protein